MKVKYNVLLKIEIFHEIDETENLKSDREYAESISQMISDEATFSGGVACCDIVKSSVDITNVNESHYLNRFTKVE